MKIWKTALLFLTSVLALNGCKTNGETPPVKTVKYVKVHTISGDDSGERMVLNGKIKEKSLTSLSFRVGGPLAKLNVEPGDYVRAGQVVAVVDKRDYELQLETTKAQYEQLESEYKRYKQLVEQNKIPENTFEKIKSGYLMAKTSYENAQNQLRDTELEAPFSGYIYEKFSEAHQTVGPGAPIVSLIDMSHLEAVVAVSESQLQKVRSDKESYLTVANANVSMLPVSLLSVGEKAMPDGLYEVKFSFKNSEALKIAPGMTAEVTLICDKEENSLTIPATAVFHEKTSNYVWVYNSATNKVEKREVALGGLKSQAQVQIKAGLKYGEQVVTAGVHYLVDGQKVKTIQNPSVTNVGGLL
ncbi:efflux RND transporter periplasmic adaptor subunit [Prolixibacteraceae bacterium Z1-6]|uniref:Efflux RND transporter periplasmic adaptor subunit n=1 Tax=Draconibacterium aestuarii TaxID=2998507 RepID=A0A9X3J823_9BACT|nr:efflux RND transporter periplasmic adaptor subunit [Prolixibacteraceae bacterium Z1-6]